MARPFRARKFLRIVYNSPTMIRVNRSHRAQVKLVQKTVEAKIVDLSEGGCGLEIAYFIPRGTQINFFLKRKDLQLTGDTTAVSSYTRITGKIASCSIKGIKRYRLGIQFVRIDAPDKAAINKFVKFHERDKVPEAPPPA